MPYLVDGNNVMGMALGYKKASRRELVALIRALQAKRGGIYHIFFDGPPDDHFVADTKMGPIRLQFSGGRNADTLIVDCLRKSKTPKNLTVVTSDRALATACRHLGARVVSAAEFAGHLATAAFSTSRATDKPDPVDIAFWEEYFSRNR